MTVLRRVFEVLVEITGRLDEEVEKGYDLTRWGDQMKFLHALQVQAQALIDLVVRASALLGRPPETPVHAAMVLAEKGVLDREDVDFFRRVVGFRNVVVHEYTRVSMEIVDRILSRREYRRLLTLARKIVERLPQDP